MSNTIDKQRLVEHLDREIIIVKQQEEVVMTAIMKAHWKGTLEVLNGLRNHVAAGAFDIPNNHLRDESEQRFTEIDFERLGNIAKTPLFQNTETGDRIVRALNEITELRKALNTSVTAEWLESATGFTAEDVEKSIAEPSVDRVREE